MRKFNIDVKSVEDDDARMIDQVIDQDTWRVYIENILSPKHKVPDMHSQVCRRLHTGTGIPSFVDDLFAMGGYLAQQIGDPMVWWPWH